MFFGGKYGHGMGGFQGGDRIAPTITSNASASVEENATLSHSLTASETVTWSIVGGADQARFEISGSTLRWASNGTKDFEAPDDANTDNAYVVNVRATDALGNTSDQTVTITVTDVAEGPSASWPLTDAGVEADWSFAGDAAFWNGSGPGFDGGESDDIASLTGAAKTAFDAAVSDSTACSVTVTASGYFGGGSAEIRMKGGSWVDMLINNDGPFTQTVTSGTGSGFDVRGKNGSVLNVADVDITLA